MDTFLYIIFLTLPLIILLYVSMTASRYTWTSKSLMRSFISIMVVAVIGVAVVIPILNSLTPVNNTTGENISKTWDEMMDNKATQQIVSLLPIVAFIGAIMFFLYVIGTAISHYEPREKKEKKKKPKYIEVDAQPVHFKIDDKQKQQKDKEVVTSGWGDSK